MLQPALHGQGQGQGPATSLLSSLAVLVLSAAKFPGFPSGQCSPWCQFLLKKILRETVSRAESIPAGRGTQLSPSWGSIQGCSHWEQRDPGAALTEGTGWEWESLSQECLKRSLRIKALAQPSACSQFGKAESSGASGMTGMAPTLSLEPFPQLQREVEPPPAAALLLRLRGWIPVLPLLLQDAVAGNGSQGCWGPVWGQLGAGGQRGVTGGSRESVWDPGRGGTRQDPAGRTRIHPCALRLSLAGVDEEAAAGEHPQECPAPCHCHPPAAPGAFLPLLPSSSSPSSPQTLPHIPPTFFPLSLQPISLK